MYTAYAGLPIDRKDAAEEVFPSGVLYVDTKIPGDGSQFKAHLKRFSNAR
jgi:hypothetical protein